MGLIATLMDFVFGGGRNVVAETAEVFRVNAEKADVREADAKSEALQQFSEEFLKQNRGVFDRIVDALNRLPRPFLALGTIWLFVTAMQDPEKFTRGMEGIALVPEPLWWLMGAIVSFYFGARHQAHAQEFQRSVARSLTMAQHLRPPAAPRETDGQPSAPNAALSDWQAGNG